MVEGRDSAFCVVCDYYPALALQASQYLEFETTEIVRAPVGDGRFPTGRPDGNVGLPPATSQLRTLVGDHT